MKKILFILCVTVIAFTGCVEEPCDNVICLNNGVPIESGEDCFCECPTGFEGPSCENEIQDPCLNIECENDGTCNTDGTCTCPPGFGGDNCEILLCAITECQNGGTCVTGVCDCPEGFSGTNCEVDDACAGVTCNNGGICITGVCDCPDGFTGTDCSIEIATAFIAEWDVLESCAAFYMGEQFTYIATIRENVNMGGLEIVNFGAFDPYSAFTSISVSDNTITLNLSEIMTTDGTFLVEGSGVLSEDGNTIDWTYTSSENGVEDTCSGTWTRKDP